MQNLLKEAVSHY